MRIGLRYPVEVGLVGDSKATLAALLPLLQRAEDRSFLEKAQAGMREWWTHIEESATRSDVPMKPQVVAWELGKRLEDDAMFFSDSGTITTWAARYVKIRRGQLFTLSGNLASMANALPYAIAAQLAFPERQSVAFVGDGGFSMLMAEFATCVKYKLPIKVVVIKNSTLGQIKWEQMVFLGNPEYGSSCTRSILSRSPRRAAAPAFRSRIPRECGRGARAGAGGARTCSDRGRGRSVRAANAAQDHARPGGKVRRIPAARRAEPREDRPHRRERSDPRADLRTVRLS